MPQHPITDADRQAIRDLLSLYCHAMDAGRADLCIRLFSTVARIATPVGEAVGRDAIRAWIDERLALRSPDHQVAHYLLNPLVEGTGASQASVRSMLLYTRQLKAGGSPVEVLSGGIYEDSVVKEEGRWRFSERTYGLSLPLGEGFFPAGV